MRKSATTVAVLEALRDVRLDRNIVRPPRWIGTEAAQLIDSILKSAGGSSDAEINGYQFPTAATSVLQRIREETPRPPGNRLATFETPETLADQMRDLAAITLTDHVLEPSAGRGRLIAKLERQQKITAIEIDPSRAAYLAMMSPGRISHLRRAGLGRAAYWRALGFPNCARARAAKARYRLERLKREEWALAKSVNPYAFPEDAASVARDQGKPVHASEVSYYGLLSP